jgi:hypothetical protein
MKNTKKSIDIIVTFVSIATVAVSVSQFYVAYKTSQHSEAQTIEKFIPYLQNNETRDVALLIMSRFESPETIRDLAQKLPARKTLEDLKTNGSDKEKQLATNALVRIDHQLEQLIDNLFSIEKTIRTNATSELIQNWSNDSLVIPKIIEKIDLVDANNTSYDKGLVNALYVINSTQSNNFVTSASELEDLMNTLKNKEPHIGAQASALVNQIEFRIKHSFYFEGAKNYSYSKSYKDPNVDYVEILPKK